MEKMSVRERKPLRRFLAIAMATLMLAAQMPTAAFAVESTASPAPSASASAEPTAAATAQAEESGNEQDGEENSCTCGVSQYGDYTYLHSEDCPLYEKAECNCEAGAEETDPAKHAETCPIYLQAQEQTAYDEAKAEQDADETEQATPENADEPMVMADEPDAQATDIEVPEWFSKDGIKAAGITDDKFIEAVYYSILSAASHYNSESGKVEGYEGPDKFRSVCVDYYEDENHGHEPFNMAKYSNLKDLLAAYDGEIKANVYGITSIEGITLLRNAKITLDGNKISTLAPVLDQAPFVDSSNHTTVFGNSITLTSNPVHYWPKYLLSSTQQTYSVPTPFFLEANDLVYVRGDGAKTANVKLDVWQLQNNSTVPMTWEDSNRTGEWGTNSLGVDNVDGQLRGKNPETVKLTNISKTGSYTFVAAMPTDAVEYWVGANKANQNNSIEYYYTVDAQFYSTIKQAPVRVVTLGGFTFTKTSDEEDKAQRKPLSGAEYTLKKADGGEFQVLQDGKIQSVTEMTFTTNEKGVIEGKDIAAGNYTLTETKAPDGYQLDSTPISITIENPKPEDELTGLSTENGDLLTTLGVTNDAAEIAPPVDWSAAVWTNKKNDGDQTDKQTWGIKTTMSSGNKTNKTAADYDADAFLRDGDQIQTLKGELPSDVAGNYSLYDSGVKIKVTCGSNSGTFNSLEAAKTYINTLLSQSGLQSLQDNIEVTYEGGDTLYYRANDTVIAGNTASATDEILPVYVPMQAKKVLTGGDLKGDDFTFALTPDNDAAKKVLATEKSVTNTADGLIDFGTLKFDKPDTYVFKMQEKEPNPIPADMQDIIFDTAEYTVTITVTAGKSGLTAAVNVTPQVNTAGTPNTITYTSATTNQWDEANKQFVQSVTITPISLNTFYNHKTPFMTKSADKLNQEVKLGDTITYTLTIYNYDTALADVKVFDDLPKQVELQQWKQDNGEWKAASTWNENGGNSMTLAPAASKTEPSQTVLTFETKVISKWSATDNTENVITNQAFLEYKDTKTPTDIITDWVAPTPQYTMEKTRVSKAPAVSQATENKYYGFKNGDTVTYQVAVTNTGDIALNMDLKDVFAEATYFTNVRYTEVKEEGKSFTQAAGVSTTTNLPSTTGVSLHIEAGRTALVTITADVKEDTPAYLALTTEDVRDNKTDGYVNTATTYHVKTDPYKKIENVTYTTDDKGNTVIDQITGKDETADLPDQTSDANTPVQPVLGYSMNKLRVTDATKKTTGNTTDAEYGFNTGDVVTYYILVANTGTAPMSMDVQDVFTKDGKLDETVASYFKEVKVSAVSTLQGDATKATLQQLKTWAAGAEGDVAYSLTDGIAGVNISNLNPNRTALITVTAIVDGTAVEKLAGTTADDPEKKDDGYENTASVTNPTATFTDKGGSKFEAKLEGGSATANTPVQQPNVSYTMRKWRLDGADQKTGTSVYGFQRGATVTYQIEVVNTGDLPLVMTLNDVFMDGGVINIKSRAQRNATSSQNDTYFTDVKFVSVEPKVNETPQSPLKKLLKAVGLAKDSVPVIDDTQTVTCPELENNQEQDASSGVTVTIGKGYTAVFVVSAVISDKTPEKLANYAYDDNKSTKMDDKVVGDWTDKKLTDDGYENVATVSSVTAVYNHYAITPSQNNANDGDTAVTCLVANKEDYQAPQSIQSMVARANVVTCALTEKDDSGALVNVLADKTDTANTPVQVPGAVTPPAPTAAPNVVTAGGTAATPAPNPVKQFITTIIPQTGDNSPLGVLVVLAVISAVAFGVVFAFKRRNDKKVAPAAGTTSRERYTRADENGRKTYHKH